MHKRIVAFALEATALVLLTIAALTVSVARGLTVAGIGLVLFGLAVERG